MLPLLNFWPEPERQLKENSNIYPGRPARLLGMDIKDILQKITSKIAHDQPLHSGIPCQYWAGISIQLWNSKRRRCKKTWANRRSKMLVGKRRKNYSIPSGPGAFSCHRKMKPRPSSSAARGQNLLNRPTTPSANYPMKRQWPS